MVCTSGMHGIRAVSYTHLDLMNVMEREFGTFRIYPTEEFMAREEVKLYHEISMARDL